MSTGSAEGGMGARRVRVRRPALDSRRSLEDRLAELEAERIALFAQSGVPMLVTDPSDGAVYEANAAAAELFRCTPDQLVGAPVDSVLLGGLDALPGGSLGRLGDPDESDQLVALSCRDGRTRVARLNRCRMSRSMHELELLVLVPVQLRDSRRPSGRIRRSRVEEATHQAETEFPEIIGRSPEIRNACRLVGKVARAPTTVLIEGESGTGKELFARAIHFHSPRAEGPFIRVNCAALTETLLESELFGHVRGAFTGAIRDREGRFRRADGGTILLDEIGSMCMAGQSKLLRVLQEGEFEPVGSSATRTVDARVIATTNVNLKAAVREGRFREDLFYRLRVINLELPPLRERPEDIPLMAMSFASRYARQLRKEIDGFHPAAIEALLGHSWPGNVRELENVIERAVLLEERSLIQSTTLQIGPEGSSDSPSEDPPSNLSLRERLHLIERQIVVQTLQQTNWVRKDAAEKLGIDPRNLGYFLKKHDIREGDRESAPAEEPGSPR